MTAGAAGPFLAPRRGGLLARGMDARQGKKLGGKAVESKTLEEYAKDLKVDQLRNEDDVLDLAARLELGGTNAYLGLITVFKDPALAKIAARLAADEAAHLALLNFDLKRPFAKALSFGA